MMTTVVEINTNRRVRRVVPSVSVASVSWPVDKIALVVGAVLAVLGALVITGSGQVASWAGVVVGLGAYLVTRLHYGAAVTARAS